MTSLVGLALYEPGAERYGPLYYHSPLRLLICTACQHAIILARVHSHLQGRHSTAKKERDTTLLWAQSLPTPGVLNTEAELQVFPFPPVLTPILGLGPPKRHGLRCNLSPSSCWYIATTRAKMLQHFREAHQWSNTVHPPGKGLRHAVEDPYKGLWVEGVPYQQLFPKGVQSRLFEVRSGTGAASTGPTPEEFTGTTIDDPATPSTGSQQGGVPAGTGNDGALIRHFEAQGAQIRDLELRRIQPTVSFLEPNAWLERLGAPRHLTLFSERKDFLLSLISLPGPTPTSDDPTAYNEYRILQALYGALDLAVLEGQVLLRLGKAPWFILSELGRRDTAHQNHRPFHFRHRGSTLRRYTEVYRQFLTYTLRTIGLPIRERPPFKVTNAVSGAWDRVKAAATTFSTTFPAYQYAPSFGVKQRPEWELDISTGLAEVARPLLGFITAVFQQELYESEFDSVLVSFLAITALRRDHMWEEPWAYTPRLSAITTLFKVFFFLDLHYARQARVTALIDAGSSTEEAEGAEPSMGKLLEREQNIYLIESSVTRLAPTPYRWVVKIRNYGRTIAANTPRSGHVQWEGDTVLYKDLRLSIPALFETVNLTILRAREILLRDLLFSKAYETSPINISSSGGEGIKLQPVPDIPSIPWPTLLDNVNRNDFGFSFVSTLTQDLLPETRSWVFQRVLATEQRTQWFPAVGSGPKDGGVGPIRRETLLTYGAKIERFLEALAFLTHSTGGQASRGTELLSLRYKNTQEGGLRNVFIDRGLVMLVTGYHKGYNQSGRAKAIQRFLPEPVGSLLVYYLWLVLPFWEGVLATSRTGPLLFSPFIWPPDWRTQEQGQVPIGSARGASEGAREPGGGVQAVQRPWNSLRLTKALTEAFVLGSGQKVGLNHWRHLNKAITRRYLRNITLEDGSTIPFTTLGGLLTPDSGNESGSSSNDSGSEDDLGALWNAQAGHTGRTARNVYGRLIGEGVFEDAERRATFRSISIAWHRFLRLTPIPEDRDLTLPASPLPLTVPRRPLTYGVVPLPRKRRSSTILNVSQPNPVQQARLLQLRQADLNQALRNLYGPLAQFRGRQEEVLQAIQEGKNPIVAVAATGSGKSLSFFLPASISAGVSLVIVPLVSLQEDLETRARKLQICSVSWRERGISPDAKLVFTTPESVFTPACQEFLTSMTYRRALDRIFVDECHSILEGSDEFRPRLKELGRLGQLGVQIIYLSATLPPSQEPTLFHRLYWEPSEVSVIREPTTRTNIEYRVETIPQGPRVTFYASLRSRFKHSLAHSIGDRGIIFCSTVREVEELAAALPCRGYHSGIGTREEKSVIVSEWTLQSSHPTFLEGGRVIATTSALGLGLDIGTVRLVVHVGPVYRLQDYSQESGRAGRDGAPSKAILFSSSRRPMGLVKTAVPEGLQTLQVSDYLSNTYCRRVVLDFVLDGRRDRLSCGPDEVACDLCRQPTVRALTAPYPLPQPTSTSTPSRLTNRSPSPPALDLQATKLHQDGHLISQRINRRERFEASVASNLRDTCTELLKLGCLWCFLEGEGPKTHAEWSKCGNIDLGSSIEVGFIQAISRTEKILRSATGFRAFSGCTRCFLPQALCDGWEQTEVKAWVKVDNPCQLPGILLPYFFWLFFGDGDTQATIIPRQLLKLLWEYDKYEPHGPEETKDKRLFSRHEWEYLRQRRVFGGLEGSNLVFFFQLLFSLADDDLEVGAISHSLREALVGLE